MNISKLVTGLILLLPSTVKLNRPIGFRLEFLNLTLAYSNGQLDSWNGVSPNILPSYFTVLKLEAIEVAPSHKY